ncbi:transferase family-domain-containing protein [Hypoxylon sp. FL1857]|nr:transferase family-domain-containing protein [Hypoxylon sp. FL1857]
MEPEQIHVTLTPLDHLHPTNYVKLFFYFPLKPDASATTVFSGLHEALYKTFVQLPWLSGKVYRQDPTASGWRPGQREIRYRPVDAGGPRPHQLRFKELPTEWDYEDLKEDGFPIDAFAHEDLLSTPVLGDIDIGADLFISQANFLPGCCILAVSNCHAALDGPGMITVIKVWAQNYRGLHGGDVELEQVPAESSDRTLLDRLWAQKGIAHPPSQADPWTRGLVGIGFEPLKEIITIPPPKVMKQRMFYMSRTNLVALQRECEKETGPGILSSGDSISALLWRCLLKARKSATGNTLPGDSVLEMPVEARAEFSESVPPSYIGSCCFFNHATLPLTDLTANSTPLGHVARVIRSVAGRVNTQVMHDAYAVMRDVPDYTLVRQLFKGVYGADLFITNNLLFPIGDICFGDVGFANGGHAEELRISMGPYNDFVRVAFIMPRKRHGGVELNISLFNDEMEILLEDKEFGKFCLPL